LSRSTSFAAPRPDSILLEHAVGCDDRPVTEEAIFREHRAALDATVFKAGGPKEFVFGLEAGRLRRQP